MDTVPEFPSRFAYRRLDELPGGGRGPIVHYFPEPTGLGGGQAVLLEPRGAPAWIGVFREGHLASKAHSGLHGHPDGDSLCVVSRGDGYLVDVVRRTAAAIAPNPVFHVWPAVEQGLLLVADPWQIVAFDSRGERWRTERLAIDGLRLVRQTGDWLTVIADPQDEAAELKLDLATGRSTRC